MSTAEQVAPPKPKRVRKAKIADTAAPAPTITTVKGFNRDLTCRGFQFEVGKTYEVSGKVEACSNGWHACEYALDCFGYYAPATSRYFEVEQGGDLSRHDQDSKVASAKITIGVELSISEVVARAFKWVWDHATLEAGSSATGYRGAASATGYQGAASATGNQGAASATGNQGAASATGNQGAASATGNQGAASATGYQGAASATGYQGAASATGYQGAASATGYQGAASATGYQGAASATGDRGAASATGYRGAASATGDQGAASATGKFSTAASTGWNGSASAAEGGAIFLVNRDDNTGEIRHVFASKVGENGVLAGVFYTLTDAGELAEAK